MSINLHFTIFWLIVWLLLGMPALSSLTVIISLVVAIVADLVVPNVIKVPARNV